MDDMYELNRKHGQGISPIPNGWRVADTSPSGLNRLLPDDCRPISLQHTRTYSAAKFSAGFWLTAWFVFMAGLGSYVGLHLVHVL